MPNSQLSIRTEYLPFGRPHFTEEEIAAVSRVMRSGWVGMGPETIAFEHELRAYLGVSEVVTVNSCTSALFLSLIVAGVQPGDEVICPSLTWCSTANSVLYAGAKPIFCDVDEKSFSASVEDILGRVTERTRAVIIVHFGGYAMDVGSLRKMLPPHVTLIEDAAHALGALYPNGFPVGSSGNATCFSFYANKNLCTAEGGAIAISDPQKADRIKSLRQHGLPIDAWKRFTHPKSVLFSSNLTDLGFKMNYTDLQAAIGRVQLRRLDDMQRCRGVIVARYQTRLKDMDDRLMFQTSIGSASHAKHLVSVKLEGLQTSRNDLLLELRARNIGATVHYAPLHRMPLYSSTEIPRLPVTDKLAASLLTLPISAGMTMEDVDYVSDQLLDLLT